MRLIAYVTLWAALNALLAGSSVAGQLQSSVAEYRGAPVLMINGDPLGAAGYSNYWLSASICYDFGLVECRLFDFPATASAWDGGNIPQTWAAPASYDYSQFDSSIQRLLSVNPDALVIPRIYIGTPTWWLDANPAEMEVTENGTPNYSSLGIRPRLGPYPSLASIKWRQEMGDAIDKLIDHIEARGWTNSVIGFKISGLMTEEWYHWSSGGNSELAGYSSVTQNGFRQWLRTHYNNDVGVLRTSWNHPTVTFDTATVPTPAQRRANSGTRTFRDALNEQNVIDWYGYYNELVPEVMDYFAGRIKSKTGGAMIVGGFYGYSYDFMGNPEFGHDALLRYYTAANLDFIYVTASYGNLDQPAADPVIGIPGNYQRGLGGADYPRGPDYSARLHGKLWYNNNDFRTILAPARMRVIGYSEDAIRSALLMGGYAEGLQNNLWLLRRHAGMVACNGMFEDIFDIDGAYYDSAPLMAEIGNLNRFAERAVRQNRSSASEILIVSDERSCFYPTFASWDNALLNSALYAPPAQLAKLGAPVDYVLLDDLPNIDPARYKLIVLTNCYHMFDHQRAALDRFKRDGKMIVFCYAPGYFNHRSAQDANMASLTGMNIVASTNEALIAQQVQIVPGGHPLATALFNTGKTPFGATRASGKLFSVADPSAVVLGTRPGSSTCTMAYRDLGAWRSVYSCTAALPDAAWRELARYAGVHLYNDGNDTLYACRSMLTLHANGAGSRTIRWPHKGHIYDALSETLMAQNADQVTVNLQNGETVIYRIEETATTAAGLWSLYD